MQIMILGRDDAADLGLRLAESRGIAPISVGGKLSADDGSLPPALEQELERAHQRGGFVLRDGPVTAEQAAALDSLLDALDAPLELVIEIDTVRKIPADLSTAMGPGESPLSEYYRKRGLLRRIRGEGEAGERLATAVRIIDDLLRARRPEEQDPFASALLAIAREAPPPEPSPTAAPPAPDEKSAGESRPEPPLPSPRPGPAWKLTADRKGRLRRQPAGGKEWRKPRR